MVVAIDLRAELRKERERRAAQQAGAPVAQSGQTAEKKAGDAALQAIVDSNGQGPSVSFHSLDYYSVAPGVVQGLYYIPDFITEKEETAIANFIDAMPGRRWVAAGERRMLNWGGRPGDLEIKEALPGSIQKLVERMVQARVYEADQAPNHCLVNEYLLGAGIPPHQDGALYSPCVATITLEGPAMMDFHAAKDSSSMEADGSGTTPGTGESSLPVAQVLLQPRGLLLMRGDAYNRLLHSIPSQAADSVSSLCANTHLAKDATQGCTIHRAAKRKSLVFVHKRRL